MRAEHLNAPKCGRLAWSIWWSFRGWRFILVGCVSMPIIAAIVAASNPRRR